MGLTQPVHNLVDWGLRLRRTRALKTAIDVVLMALAAAFAWLIAFSQQYWIDDPLPFVMAVVVARLPVYYAFGLHRMAWRMISLWELMSLLASAIVGVSVITLVTLVVPLPFTDRGLLRPWLLLLTEPALYVIFLGGARVAIRSLARPSRSDASTVRMLVIGASDPGIALAYQIQESDTSYDIIGFVDDDPYLQGQRIRGVPVLGVIADLPDIAAQTRPEQIIIALPSLRPEQLRAMLTLCAPTEVPVRILPPLRDLVEGQAPLSALRQVRMEDLLPRAEVKPDRTALSSYLAGRTALVTGGGGSIGSELCRQLVAGGVARLLVLGRGENSVFEIIQELQDSSSRCELIPVICDVRDLPALERMFMRHRPDVVFHAAAHKHVPLMEQYPAEAIKNNVIGTLNVVQSAVEVGVERFVLVSTDKAVSPSSIMGATKRVAEMIVKAYARSTRTNMVSVRFGNVLGSRGSVVPVMTRQIERRLPVTVTDPDMVRYFMTIPEAVELILHAGAIGGGGEVFVLDMGRPVRILDLAYDLIRLAGLVPEQDIPIRVVGRRPGEKVKEDLLTPAEVENTQKHGYFYTAHAQAASLDDLLPTIARLRRAADEGCDSRIIQLLQEIVPAFGPDSSAGCDAVSLLPPPRGDTAETLDELPQARGEG